jgi:Carboxypeptidase regulatory-like domain
MSLMRFRCICTAATAGGLIVACDKTPTRPTLPPSPPTGPTISISRLEILGPSSVAPNEEAQFTAIAQRSDQTTLDVTKEAAWRTSDAAVLPVSPAGVATGRERGEATLLASFGGRSSVKANIFVLPSGTYRLSGKVFDEGFPVPGARVELTNGPGAGLSTISTDGSYRLYGASGDTELRVTKEGYQEERRRLLVTGHQVLDIDIRLSKPRDLVSGSYTLTIEAASECRSLLPEAAWKRTYTANITQNGPSVVVALSNATFFTEPGNSHNRFTGIIELQHVTFNLAPPFDYSSYLPEFLEMLTPTTFLAIIGSATTTESATSRAGSLDATFWIITNSFRYQISCKSANHRFTLSQ